MKLKLNLLISLAGILLIILFIFGTNPTRMSAYGLLLLPILVGVTFYNLSKLAIGVFLPSVDSRDAKLISVLSVLFPVLVLTLGALKQLSLLDVLLVFIFSSGILLYFRRQQTLLSN